MATSQKLTEHFLTCTICTEVFDKPCTLVCNHTFCRKCVVSYTKTRPEATSAKSLQCPFCRKMTKVSDPERPVEEWADDVKPIFVIQGLLDSFGPGSKDTTNCSYCKEEGETTPATSWCYVCDDALCERCTRMHQRIPSARHHDVADLNGETRVKVKRNVMCNVHKNKRIKYICKDCKTAVCQTCCTIHHRKCDLVVEIESEIPAMKIELRKNKEHLLKKHNEMKTHIGKQNSKVREELAHYLQIESNIKSASLTAIEVIKAKERKLLFELEEMSERHFGQLKADIKSGEISIQMYQQQVEFIDQALQSECDMDVYEMYQRCEAGDVEAVGVIDVKEKGGIDKITFRQETDKLSRALDDLHLGEIHVQYDDVQDLKAAPVLQDTINVTVAGDRDKGIPFDVIVLDVNGTDTVMVTDFNNKSAKSFYTRNSQAGHSKLSLGSRPWGITRLKHDQVAVTVPYTRQIVIVEVNPDLVLLSTITTSKQYWGITSLTPSTLAASSSSPPCVEILDMSGHVLKSVCQNHEGGGILRYPYFLCTTRTGNILVSDNGTKCVVCLTPEGHVIFNYRPTEDTALKIPRGITSTSTGDILVSDGGTKCVVCLTPEGDVVFNYRPTEDTALKIPRGITSTSTGDILVTDNSQHRVIHLTESGQFVRNILTSQDGVQYPWGLRVVVMTTSQKLTEHFLTCTICTEVFDKPCTLVCNHTFCRKCVVSYTKTRPEAISAKSLLCPFCSKTTKVSDPERPVEEWADDVKPIFVIQGLLDSFGPGSEDTAHCSYCKEEGETNPATTWCFICDDALCERCTRMHKRIPSTRHHDVVDFSEETKIKVQRQVMCKVHKDENLKFLCKDCKTAVCQTCCTIHHRKCDLVVEIESEIPAMKSELRRNKENSLKKHHHMKTHVAKLKSRVKEEMSVYSQIQSNIKSASLTATEVIKVKELKLLSELKEMSDSHIGQLKADIKSGEMSVQMYQQQAEVIDQALQSECDMDVYEMYQGCEAGDVEAVGVVDVKENGRIDRITFRQDTDKLNRALDDLQLGEIHVQFDDVLDLEAGPVSQDTNDVLGLKATPVLQDTITVTVAGDRVLGHPVDVTMLDVNGTDTVVVTDSNNKSAKSFYTRNSLPGHSKLSLGSRPWGITRLKHNHVAVTVPYSRHIVIVEVNPDLVLLSTITTRKQYCGITSLTASASALAASSQLPVSVDILDMWGHVLKSVCPDNGGGDILKYPYFLCTTRTGNILVSDGGTNCVVCLTPEGHVIFNYRPTEDTPLMDPRGITSTSTGDILVTDNSLHRVIHLTESGHFVRNMLTSQDGVQFQMGLCVGGRGCMYVCTRFEVKVFTYLD
ncbi:uncharacterized protein [Haliotis asinina]|uniref:uncharacterized protein n=1 Tax=Haliotis asinina TaxID=109174 RepID=UPI003531A4EA